MKDSPFDWKAKGSSEFLKDPEFVNINANAKTHERRLKSMPADPNKGQQVFSAAQQLNKKGATRSSYNFNQQLKKAKS